MSNIFKDAFSWVSNKLSDKRKKTTTTAKAATPKRTKKRRTRKAGRKVKATVTATPRTTRTKSARSTAKRTTVKRTATKATSKPKSTRRRKNATEGNYWQITGKGAKNTTKGEKLPSLNAVRRKVNNSANPQKFDGSKARHSWHGKGGKTKTSVFTIQVPGRKADHCFARRSK